MRPSGAGGPMHRAGQAEICPGHMHPSFANPTSIPHYPHCREWMVNSKRFWSQCLVFRMLLPPLLADNVGDAGSGLTVAQS